MAIFNSGVTALDPDMLSPPLVTRPVLLFSSFFTVDSSPSPSVAVSFSCELLFVGLHRLDPVERKLPNVMEPWWLINGVARCCWLE